MKRQHTPGPLTYITKAQSDLVRAFDGDSNDAEHDAAVRLAEEAGALIQNPLYRAAPDLLAACQEALAMIDQACDNDDEIINHHPAIGAAIVSLSAAILRATGDK